LNSQTESLQFTIKQQNAIIQSLKSEINSTVEKKELATISATVDTNRNEAKAENIYLMEQQVL